LEDQHDIDKDDPQEPAIGWAWEEYPFDLSGHGALMLHIGIEEYMRDTRQMYESELPVHEDASYCLLRTESAMTEATKLRDWQVQRKNNADWENDLLKELASERDRFKALDDADRQRRT
jgi:hypothetical protein